MYRKTKNRAFDLNMASYASAPISFFEYLGFGRVNT